MNLKPATLGTDMLALIFLMIIHVAHSYTTFEEATLPDFDEVFDAEAGKPPDTVQDFELKRLPRKAGGEALDTGILIFETERNVLNETEFSDFIEKKESSGLVLQNLKKVSDILITRNPFFVSKNYVRDRNLFHSPTSFVDIKVHFKIVNPVATPYTRSKWEPNFLRNFIEHDE